jgi:hypothetical protein
MKHVLDTPLAAYATAMVPHYLECAQWCDAPDDCGFNSNFFDDASKQIAFIDCLYFARKAMPYFDGMIPEQAGHDLWLTRNGHGTGFWDREDCQHGNLLTRYAESMGEVNVFYVTDDNSLAIV